MPPKLSQTLVIGLCLSTIAPANAISAGSTFNGNSDVTTLLRDKVGASNLTILAKSNKSNQDKSESAASSSDAAPASSGGKPGGSANDKKPYNEEAIKHYNRGVELQQSGFLNQAVSEYKGAIESDGRMEEAFSNLGVIYAAQRNYPRARDAFTTALSLKPKRPTTLNGLGAVLYAQGHVKEAKEKWLQALAVDPKFASAYYNIGNACESEKNFPEALNIYAQAITVAPTMADAFYRIGTIYNRQHHYPQASVMLRRAIALSPDGDFVNEAKKIERTLEEDFAKRETVPSGSKKESANGADSKPKASAKKKKSGLDMFVQPSEDPAKADGQKPSDSSL